jgi:hypothetical protein
VFGKLVALIHKDRAFQHWRIENPSTPDETARAEKSAKGKAQMEAKKKETESQSP